MKTIYALLSVDNLYDQPQNNIVIWWSSKPTIEILAKAISIDFSSASDENIVSIVGVHQMKELRICETDYRLVEINEGELI